MDHCLRLTVLKLFCGHFVREVFQILHDYNLAWGLPIHTRFDDLDLISVTGVSES